MNLLELKAAHTVVLIFAERLKPESIHLQMASQAWGCISVHKKNGEYKKKKNQPNELRIVEILIGNEITITAEYLPGKLKLNI